jgi:hypothetical protein
MAEHLFSRLEESGAINIERGLRTAAISDIGELKAILAG